MIEWGRMQVHASNHILIASNHILIDLCRTISFCMSTCSMDVLVISALMYERVHDVNGCLVPPDIVS